MPSPTDVVAAWPRKPSQHSDEVGTPACSAIALARNTAGVQLPQHAIPEMTASMFIDLILPGSSAEHACSSSPCVEPNASWSTKRHAR